MRAAPRCWPRGSRFAAAINAHGGDAEVLHLPSIGIRGNTHFPFSDLNNVRIADLLSDYLAKKRLDVRAILVEAGRAKRHT